MIVESHITYNQEVKEGDEVDVNLIYCDYDKKRIQYKLSMFHKEKKYLAATNEVLSLYDAGDEDHSFAEHMTHDPESIAVRLNAGPKGLAEAVQVLGGFRRNLLIVSWVTSTPGCTVDFPGY